MWREGRLRLSGVTAARNREQSRESSNRWRPSLSDRSALHLPTLVEVLRALRSENTREMSGAVQKRMQATQLYHCCHRVVQGPSERRVREVVVSNETLRMQSLDQGRRTPLALAAVVGRIRKQNLSHPTDANGYDVLSFRMIPSNEYACRMLGHNHVPTFVSSSLNSYYTH